MKKKIFALYIVFLILSSLIVQAGAFTLDEVIEERVLMNGVTYKHIQRLYDYGWQDIYVISADLKSPGVKLDVLKSKNGESYLENTLQMAKNNNAIAAINADFFASKRGEAKRGSAVGVEVRNGELKSSASVEESMNTFYKNFGDNKFYVDAFDFDITLTSKDGQTDKIKVVNKYDDLTGIVMYTDDWAEKSVGSVGGIIEVSVDKNGVVLEKATESEPLIIPDGGYVLSSHMDYNTFLLDFVNVGDKINVDIKSTPDLEKIETAVGGGGIILKDGKVPDSFSHNITGRNPRSAVGVDKSGTVITLLALDGRRADAKGMTQTELGYLMSDFGCYTALNLDGGGSTLMAVENEYGEKEVVNKPSDGSYRSVSNSLGIISTAEDNLPLESLKIEAEDNVFKGTSINFKLTGFDKYKRREDVDPDLAKYTADGMVNNGKFYPSKDGQVKLSALVNGLSASKEFNVLDLPREMNFTETKIGLNSNENYTPTIIGKDTDGKMAQINLSDTDITISGNAVVVLGDEIIAKQKGASVITAKFGEVTANIAVMVDGADEVSAPDNIVLKDSQNKESELSDGGLRFAVFGNTRKVSVLYDLFLINRSIYKMKEMSSFQVFLGADAYTNQIDKALDNYVLAKNYNCFVEKNNTFITLPNVSGNIYNGDASVFARFEDDVEKSNKNLFIFLDRNYITNHIAEMQAFKRIVNKASESGKNVYVFGGGFVNKNTIEDGVRYINTAGIFPSISLEGTSPSYIKYVLVTVNGDEITYEYRSVFGE